MTLFTRPSSKCSFRLSRPVARPGVLGRGSGATGRKVHRRGTIFLRRSGRPCALSTFFLALVPEIYIEQHRFLEIVCRGFYIHTLH
ncbi:hypothetical protein B0H12DRAFT_1143567 [Mycena haematopus]|nr:hypothetical protein B0H12DRAFT_1143567 [Mycena haematopus]